MLSHVIFVLVFESTARDLEYQGAGSRLVPEKVPICNPYFSQSILSCTPTTPTVSDLLVCTSSKISTGIGTRSPTLILN